MRRSKKLSCKKGGVDCRVSRRERDFTNTFGPTTSCPSQLNSQSKEPREEFAGKKFYRHFPKVPSEYYLGPHPSLFFSSHRQNTFTFTRRSTPTPSWTNPSRARLHTPSRLDRMKTLEVCEDNSYASY